MDLNEYQKKVENTWISNEHDLIRIILGIIGESGEVAEKFKKYYRGDYEEQKGNSILIDMIEKEVGDIFYYIAKLCNHYGINLEKVLEKNINKLAKRKQEGKIHGSGDNR